MEIEQRIKALNACGQSIKSDLDSGRLEDLFLRAEQQNPWYIPEFSRYALEAVCEQFLSSEKINSWLKPYEHKSTEKQTVGLILAGNLPLVGLHDLICVFISGHKAMLKLSSKDSVLMNYLIETLEEVAPESRDYMAVVDKLAGFDAVIATGSNNTNRYFEYYFRDYPSLLRSSRSSIAVLNGDEKASDLNALTDDIFRYFGLGCRSVSKLYVPNGYEFNSLLESFSNYDFLSQHSKYFNNYEYYKSVFLINGDSHFDTGFAILRKHDALASPVGVVNFEFYDEIEKLDSEIEQIKDEVQIVVGKRNNEIPFGESQNTGLEDYADGIDTLSFLLDLPAK